MGLLRIQLLGGFRAERDGDVPQPATRWARPGARTLVKLLAVTPGHQLHREDVMAVCWPHAEHPAALRSLRVALHAARHTLEPELAPRAASSYLVGEGSLLRFAPGGVVVDVDEAARAAARALEGAEGWGEGRGEGEGARAAVRAALRAALRACEAEVLPEDRYAAWAEPCRARLARLRGQLSAALATASGPDPDRAPDAMDDAGGVRLGWALTLDRSGRYGEAVRVLREALELYAREERHDARVRAAARLAEALTRSGHTGPDEALAVLGAHPPLPRTPPVVRAAYHTAHARVLSYIGDYVAGLAAAREAERWAEEALGDGAQDGQDGQDGQDESDRRDDPDRRDSEAVGLQARALAQQAVCSGLLDDFAHAVEPAERALGAAEASGDTALLAHVLSVLRENARRAGLPHRALDYGRRALDLAEQGGRPTATSFERANLAELHLALGEPEEAERLARAAVALAEPFGGTALAFALAALASVRAGTGGGEGGGESQGGGGGAAAAVLLDRAERCAREGGHRQAMEKVREVREAWEATRADSA